MVHSEDERRQGFGSASFCPFWQQDPNSWLSLPAGTKCSLPRTGEVFMSLGKCLRPGKKKLALKHREKLQNQKLINV